MRRLLPRTASLLAVLLLTIWGGSAASCLAAMRFDPGQVLCHTPDSSPDRQDPGHQASGGCPLCAPLPPALIGSAPAFAAPRMDYAAFQPIAHVAWTVPTAQPTPQQPRAPPTLA